MPNLTEQAIKDLRAGVARAKQIPKGFNMSVWIIEANSDAVPCGTIGCLAFEILAAKGENPNELLSKHRLANRYVAQAASDLLKNDNNNVDTSSLFHIDNWPVYLRNKYIQAENPEQRVEVLEKVVELWIAGDGKFKMKSNLAKPDLICIGCGKTPNELQEYIDMAMVNDMTPDEYIWEEEGTLNRYNGHFLCTSDYIKWGMPSSPVGWIAP